MKRFIYLSVSIIMLSCASAKLAKVPVGDWDYTITGTPSGDFAGVLSVTLADDQYSASLISQGGKIPLDKPVYDKKTKKLTGTFDYQGTLIDFETTTEGDSMKGS